MNKFIFFINIVLSKEKYITLDKDYVLTPFHHVHHLDKNDFLHIEEDIILKPHSSCNGDNVWGSDRINQESLPLDGVFLDDSSDYNSYGENIDVYVIDTGVNNHEKFLRQPIWLGELGDKIKSDINGHGTHVAGTIAGKNVGVAYRSTIYSVKISMNPEGHAYCSDMARAVDIVIENMKKTGKNSVINLSYGMCRTVSLKLNQFMSLGGIANVAAGNDNTDSCSSGEYIDFDLDKGFIVGSTNRYDDVSDFSNYGSCVEMYAPGSHILSLDSTSETQCLYMSGTSMASPMVAGVVSAYWSEYSDLSNDIIISNIKLNSIKNQLDPKNKIINNNLISLNLNFKPKKRYYLIIALISFLIIISLFLYFCLKSLSKVKINPIEDIERIEYLPSPVVRINNEGIFEDFEEKSIEKSIENSFDRQIKLEGIIKNNQENVSIIDIPMAGYILQIEELKKNPPIPYVN